MQAAAAQAESTAKAGTLGTGFTYRLQSVASSVQSPAQRTISPVVVRSVDKPISPMPVQQPRQQQQQQQLVRSSRGRHDPPASKPAEEIARDARVPHQSKKGAHVLEPAHGDIILKRRTSSQKTGNDEDHSITAISSMALSAGHSHHRHRTSTSRSRRRHETMYEKRTSDHSSHKQKRTTTPSSKSNTRRRWLKGRRDSSTEVADEAKKHEAPATTKTTPKSSKKKGSEGVKRTSSLMSKMKESLSSDNNRVYGVPNTNGDEKGGNNDAYAPPEKIDEATRSESDGDQLEESNTYMLPPRDDDITQSKECDTLVTSTNQQRPTKARHPPKVPGTDGEILSKVDEDTR